MPLGPVPQVFPATTTMLNVEICDGTLFVLYPVVSNHGAITVTVVMSFHPQPDYENHS